MAGLDASADWSVLWRQLSQLGWRQDQQRKSNTCYYIPPSMSSTQKSKSTQRDYYDTREQVREYLVELKEPKSAGSSRSRYESGRGAAERPGKRTREGDSGDSEQASPDDVRPRDRKRAAAPAAVARRDDSDSEANGAEAKQENGAAAASGSASSRAGSQGAAGEEERRIKEAAHAHSRGGRRARMIDVPKHLYTNAFAAAVHAYIKEQGMSQDALGSRTGLRQQQISGWLFGKCSASMHEMVERTLRNWFQQRGVDLDKPGVRPDLAAEDKVKLVPPGQETKKQKTERSSTQNASQTQSADDEEIPSDGSWFAGEILAVTSDGVDAAPFWLGVCQDKRRATARKVRVRWLKAIAGIGPEGPLAYTKDAKYVYDDETDPEQVFADTVLFRTKRRASVHDKDTVISLAALEFQGAVSAAEQYALANQSSDESGGSGSEEEMGDLSPGQQVSEAVKDWALKSLIFSSDYETDGGLMANDLMERFKESEKDLEAEVAPVAFHSGVLKAVQSVLGKAVRPEDLKTKERDAEDPDFRYYVRLRESGDMEGTGGWSVARALPKIDRVRRVRKKVSPLSPNPSAKDYSRAYSQGDQKSSGPSRGRLNEGNGATGAKADASDGQELDGEAPAEIDWAWLCQNCLARNLEQATRCIDCAERRTGTVEDIACADDGCTWASCSNGRPFSIFRTAVGYDTRMLLHKQTPKQALQYAGSSDVEPPQGIEQAVRDTLDNVIASLEAEAPPGPVAPQVLSEHPERPDRASCAFRRFEHFDLLDNTVRVEGKEATSEEIQTSHESGYVQSILERTVQLDDLEDCYLNSNTPLAAKVAAGTTSAVVEKVIKGEAANGVAVVRPPGHHACSHKAAGFCFFNNVAVAARTAQKQGVKRILIVDWDIHHGNGTQDIFYDDPSVLTVSIHRGDPGFFPQTGKPDELGKGRGEGFNINIAWSSAGMGDAEYMLAFSRIITPIALQFQPELVIVAAGFDSGKGDPWGECNITVPGYAVLTSQLMALSGGKIVVVLEGGYNLKTVSHSLAACVRVLRGAPPPPVTDLAPPLGSAVRDIRITENRAGQYWSVFGCSRAASVEEMEEMERFAAGGAAAARMHSQLGDLNQLTVIQLRKLCVTRKLGTKGQKVDLVAKLHADDRNVIDANRIWHLRGHKYIGRRLRRTFKGFGDIEGAVHAWRAEGKHGFVFHVVHDDGDEEDLGAADVAAAIDLLGDEFPIENDDSDEDQDRPEGHWTTGEQRRFDEAMTGRVCDKSDWHAVSMHVGTRSIAQCRSYARAKRLNLKSQPNKHSNGGRGSGGGVIKQENGGATGEGGSPSQMVPTMVSTAAAALQSMKLPRSQLVSACLPACLTTCLPAQLYETLYNRLHAIALDDNNEIACNHINSQFSDKELRFLMARNRNK